MNVPSEDLTAASNGVAGPAVVLPAVSRGGSGVRPRWSALLPLPLIGVGAGITVGALWVVCSPIVVRWTGSVEEAAARDVTFGLLAVLAGLITAVVLLVWPGERPALHAALVLTGAAGSSLLAWGVGLLLGAPPLHAVALVVLWPLVAAAVTMVRSLIGVLVAPS